MRQIRKRELAEEAVRKEKADKMRAEIERQRIAEENRKKGFFGRLKCSIFGC